MEIIINYPDKESHYCHCPVHSPTGYFYPNGDSQCDHHYNKKYCNYPIYLEEKKSELFD